MSSVYVAPSSEIAARRLGDEMVIMSVRDSTLFSLNEVATLIWQAVDGSTPLHEIVQRTVCVAFDVDPSDALEDAERFVRELARHGILSLSDRPITRGPGTRPEGA